MDKIKVLYVEDEPSLAKIVMETLVSKNFDVCHIDEGNQALSTYEAFQPHICILDVMLPNKDGYTIAREIRSINHSIPILFLTAKSQTADTIQGFQSGGNDFIKKPFSLEELILRINNLCALCYGKELNPLVQYKIGAYFFHYTRQVLEFGDEIKKLSYRESELLNMLIAKKNEVVQRNDILDKLWGDNSFFNSRNLDVYITKLRSFLKEDQSVEIITLKGVGYRLVVRDSQRDK
jgi:DNA-binding response OmpR family regulator